MVHVSLFWGHMDGLGIIEVPWLGSLLRLALATLCLSHRIRKHVRVHFERNFLHGHVSRKGAAADN